MYANSTMALNVVFLIAQSSRLSKQLNFRAKIFLHFNKIAIFRESTGGGKIHSCKTVVACPCLVKIKAPTH